MQVRVAGYRQRAPLTLFGDNLIVELDLAPRTFPSAARWDRALDPRGHAEAAQRLPEIRRAVRPGCLRLVRSQSSGI